MNIAIFASAFHPHFGGVEELCRQLALELRRQGHEVIVLTNRWPRSLARQEIFQGIPVYRVAFRAPDAGMKSEVTFRLSRGAIDRQVANILRRHAIDVLHVQCVSSNAYYALRASRAMGLPLVVTLQGELTMDATGLFERSAFARQTLRDCMDCAAMVTACSRKTLEDGEKFFGRELGERGRVIFNGASLEDFRNAVPALRLSKGYIFAIGRLVPQKGFDVLLRAFAAAGIESHDLLLAGEGSEREPLQKLAGELKLTERVKFFGRADRATVPGLFAGCEFFVLPSRQEPFGIVNLEAMAAGKAVVASRVGGVPEIIEDGVNGLLVPGEDVDALAGAMRKLVNDPELRKRLAQAGKARAVEFGWANIAGQYLQVYNQVCAKREFALT